MAQVTIQQAFDLAVQHHQAGRLREAEQLYRQILAQQPNHAVALHYLGVLAHQAGRSDLAMDLIRRAIALNPDDAEAHSNLGNVMRDAGEPDSAIAACRRAVVLDGSFAGAYTNLGFALKENGQLDDAIVAFLQAVALAPNDPIAQSNLGAALMDKGHSDEAIAALRQALALKPNYPEAWSNLGNALWRKGLLDEAAAVLRQAIALNPNLAPVHSNLGNTLKENGRLDEAIVAYRRAIALDPSYSEAYSNLLFALHYLPGHDPVAIAEEHRRWSRQHAEPLKKLIQPHSNDRDANRRLRIGYLSPDFREHAVGRFLLPLLAHHDKSQVEVFAYAQVEASDAVTERLRSHIDRWRTIVGLADGKAADLIRQDRIDILVDLAGHTARNRLTLMAQKPAPIEVTWLGYPDTTGLTSIDYRLTDALADPPGQTEQFHTEQLVRLPDGMWCYAPDANTPPVGTLPALANGAVTFGSFNRLEKINAGVLQCWAKLLTAVPGSTLLFKDRSIAGSTVRETVRQTLAREGCDADRVRFLDFTPTHEQHLAAYQMVDIALDSFPYNGTMTTCEALWMGVPVVTLAGRTHVSRVGVSMLTRIGLAELIAENSEQYVQIAAELAGDLPRLDALRQSLRGRMGQSPLMDAPGFARDVESAYRQMWRTWCETAPRLP